MLNHYLILCKSALFTKEHYVLAHYKNKRISLCSLEAPLKIDLVHCYCSAVVEFSLRCRSELTNKKL